LNVLVARRLAYRFDARPRRSAVGGTWEDLLAQVGAQMARRGDYTRFINAAVLVGGLFLAIIAGLLAGGNWMTALIFFNRSEFGVPDPAFGQDLGFYVFVMPALRAFEGWAFTVLFLSALAAVAVYAVVFTYELALNLGDVGVRLPRGIKGHLLCFA